MRLPAIILLSLALKAQNPQPANFYSTEKENALGAQLAAEVRRQTTPLNLPAVDNYATNIGLRLASRMPNSPMPWKFSLIITPKGGSTHEPISLPGGWIFIPSQLILSAHTESEFAGMLAHAMAHVALRQMTHQVSGAPSALAAIPLIFMGGPAFAGDDSNPDTDQVAVKALVAAGFDPSSLLSYIERTQFPPAPARITNLKQALQDQPESGPYIVSTDLFQSMQNQVQHGLSTTPNTPKLPSLRHPNN
jgi:predicted Zn-dependent protease